MSQSTMLAMAIGADGALAVQPTERPAPGPGEVRIAVRAAGVNRADLLQRAGLYPPPKGASPVMGLEVSGVIEALGEGVSDWRVGDAVCALLAGGGYAQAVCVDQGSLLRKPDALNFVQAASLPEAVFTVFANVFDACRLQPGERFLMHGATSGIGVVGVQMARLAGAEVFATAGTDAKCELARSLGADHAVNYRTTDFEADFTAKGGVDVILDMVGGEYVQKNINVLRESGRLVNIAYQKGPAVSVNLLRVMLKRLWITGSTLRARPVEEKRRLRDALAPVFWAGVEAGRIRPVIDSVFPLADAAEAHDRMQSGSHAGKIVLDVT